MVKVSIKKREIADAHRKYKIDIYSKFIEFTINWIFKHAKGKTKNKEKELQEELESYFLQFSKELTLWASPGVIKAWGIFRSGANQKQESIEVLTKVDNIFKAMRKDLGNSNFGLEELSLIRLFINNQDKSEDNSETTK